MLERFAGGGGPHFGFVLMLPLLVASASLLLVAHVVEEFPMAIAATRVQLSGASLSHREIIARRMEALISPSPSVGSPLPSLATAFRLSFFAVFSSKLADVLLALILLSEGNQKEKHVSEPYVLELDLIN